MNNMTNMNTYIFSIKEKINIGGKKKKTKSEKLREH